MEDGMWLMPKTCNGWVIIIEVQIMLIYGVVNIPHVNGIFVFYQSVLQTSFCSSNIKKNCNWDILAYKSARFCAVYIVCMCVFGFT